jgi:hypothetical protein
MRAWGSRYARLVLERCDNNKRQACRVLDISYHTLQAYLKFKPKLRSAQKALPAPAADTAADDAATSTSTSAPDDNRLAADRPSALEPVLKAE